MSRESVAGQAGGIERGIGDVRRHHRRDAAVRRHAERHQVGGREALAALVHRGQRDVGVRGGAPVPGIVLRAGERAGALAALDPVAHQRGDAVGIVAERAGLDDRILRQHVEVGHRREDPVDPDRPRLLGGHRPGPPGDVGIVQRGERERRRKLGEPLDLLPRAALEVRRDQQRPLGAAQQVRREAADALGIAAEGDEAADAQVERVGDGTGFLGEGAVRRGAQRRQDQPAELERVGHQRVTGSGSGRCERQTAIRGTGQVGDAHQQKDAEREPATSRRPCIPKSSP